MVASNLNFERATSIVARNLRVTSQELRESLRLAEAGDLQKLVDFRSAISGAPRSWNDHEYLRWRYGLGSANRSYSRYRILELGGKIIAGIGAEEFEIVTPTSRVTAACAMDLMSTADSRDAGLGAWLNLALFRAYPVVVALGANVNSQALVDSMYEHMEPRSEFQFPLDARPYFRRAFPLAGVGTTIGWIVSRALHLRAAWFTWKHGAAASSIAEITSFSALEWPQESSVTPHSACLYLARRPDYLDWRYFENPRSKYRALGSFDGKRLRGYVVFGGPDHSLDGNTLHLVDWWTTDPADDHTLRSLVSEVVRRAVAAGCTTIRAQASGSMTRSQLRRSGMLGEAVRSKAAGWHCRDRQQGAESFAGLEWSLTGLGDDMDCGRA